MKVRIFFFAMIFAVFFFLWRPSLEKGFVGRDDWEFYHDTFYRSGLIPPFDPTRVTENLGSTSYYQPLANVTFNLIHGIFGGQARPFYLFGFFLHSLNAVLVYRFVILLTRKETLGYMSAAIFLLYPANLETISWIGAILIHPIATFFYLLCFLYFFHFLKTRKTIRYALAVFFFFGACLSKIVAIGFISAAALLDLCFFAEELKDAKGNRLERILNWFDKYIPFVLFLYYRGGLQVSNESNH